MTAKDLIAAVVRGELEWVDELLGACADPTTPCSHDAHETQIVLPTMDARDIAWRFHELARRDAVHAVERELGTALPKAEVHALVRNASIGIEGVHEVLSHLDHEGLLEDPELAELALGDIDRTELERGARLIDLVGEGRRVGVATEALVGTWRSFENGHGYLMTPEDVADGFGWTLLVDPGGSFELSRDGDDGTSITGAWTADDTALCFEGRTRGFEMDEGGEEERKPHRVDLDADWIATMPALLLEVQEPGERRRPVAFARGARLRSARERAARFYE